ncbi:uncharacterized protein [Anabrus simplex]|uniref:uncharacterized protein n=1 Tax=Anabrus simplex TaxID=316456 RepID=UPI0035A32FCF
MVKCEESSAGSGLHHKQQKAVLNEDVIIPQSGSRRNSNGFLDDRVGGDIPYVFRLQDNTDSGSTGHDRGSVTSASVYSFYKQRIDSMFDETRSQMSYQLGSTSRRQAQHSLYQPEDEEDEKQERINNAVQARIEKMFAEMANEKSGTRKLKTETVSRKSIACNNFAVDYLGSVAIPEKVTSLQGLQQPLKELYFAYCRVKEEQSRGTGGSGRRRGTLEISGSGLKVSHKGCDETSHTEQLNPFSTIAVWAAVKFVCRRKTLGDGMEYAFLPLIADPDAIDKGALFRSLSQLDQKAIQVADSPNGESDNHHSPLFAVVMRTMGVTKQLECHGFVCSRSEDAIVIAANLYQALIVHMQSRNRRNGVKGGMKPSHKGPMNKNGISYVSIGGGSSIAGGDLNDNRSIASGREDVTKRILAKPSEKIGDNVPSTSATDLSPSAVDTVKKRPPPTKIPPPVPVRPPRKKNRSSASSASEDENIITRASTPPPSLPKPEQKKQVVAKETELASRTRHSRSESEPCTGTSAIVSQSTGVRRVASDLHGYSSIKLSSDYPETGDILTKVAIPRSKSFLNAGGPLTRYNRRHTTGLGYGNGHNGGGNGSPLGFNELFAEFRAQEGLNSLDDILDAIIDAEGMSFNDLKPIYKEFLLKLAVTLTKDELYQRSKSIMRRQRKKLNRRNSISCVKRKKTFSTGGVGLKKVFRRSVSKLKAAKSRPSSFEFTSVLFPSSVPIRSSKKLRNAFVTDSTTTSTSTSSYTSRNFQIHRQPSVKVGLSKGARLSRRQSSKKKRASPMVKRSHHHQSASDDSDFFSMVRTTGISVSHKRENATLVPNRSSSGYFSCSECSYDSESCTCISADKCYCSMGEGKNSKRRRSKSAGMIQPKDGTFSSCGFDSDSCVESDKCYCTLQQNHHHHRKPTLHTKNNSVFDQLKQRGFAVSESSLSRAASPTTAWRKNEGRIHTKKSLVGGTVKSSKSLEFLQMNPTRPNQAWNSRRTRSDESAGHFNKRMDVYETQSRKLVYHLPSDFKRDQRRSYSSDNLALDYDLFTTSSKSDEEDEDNNGRSFSPQQSKVLVVSARDPRGRIIYMGASCRSDEGSKKGSKRLPASSGSSSSRYGSRRRRHHSSGAPSSACEALSVKKSAEIAALFADMKLSQTTGVVAKTGLGSAVTSAQKNDIENGEVFYNTLEPPAEYFFSKRIGKSFLGSNLENSLGYLP